MKTLYRAFMAALLLISGLTSCEKLHDSYEDYVVPGGIVYPGRIKSPELFPGRNRVMIIWPQSLDPSIDKARIFWNTNSDSLEIPIPSSEDTISVIIEDLAEQSYSFMLKTYDAAGNSSVPVEVIGRTFGDLYQESLSNRSISISEFTPPAQLVVRWGGADITNFAYATEISYTDTLGNARTVQFPVTADTSALSDIQAGTNYQYRTLYVPESTSIDTFYTGYATMEVVAP